MNEKINVGTAGYFKMRGLTFPTMTDDTPDDTALFVSSKLVMQTIDKYFSEWKVDFELKGLSNMQLELIMKVVINTLILASTVEGQIAWLKNPIEAFDGHSLLDLLFDKQYEQALSYSFSVMN
ncbi:MAG: hypothetical protein COB38_12060 [Gammaproteobacteria bacterium]|nr:MAG: hypothetical protein COB38_12060 [Gammaproteobacteria bacterium]